MRDGVQAAGMRPPMPLRVGRTRTTKKGHATLLISHNGLYVTIKTGED